MKRILTGWLLVAALAARALGQGTILWDESVNGPLSNDYTQPTHLGTLPWGASSISGVTEFLAFPEGNGALYSDLWLFRVPESSQLSSISFTTDGQVLVWLGASFSEQLAYVFNPTNGSLLPQMNLPAASSGTYGMYIKMNEFEATASAQYRLDFVVHTIPEPASLWLLLGGLGWLGFLRWRKT